MTTKPRPQLQAPDLSALSPGDALRPPKTDPNDARFRDATQFETHAALVRGVQNGSVRAFNPDTLPERPPSPTPPLELPRRRAAEVSLSTKVPEYVMQQLRLRYAETGITIRNQILLALHKEGFEVHEDDMQDERKRPRR
jgi:hypothetical protein